MGALPAGGLSRVLQFSVLVLAMHKGKRLASRARILHLPSCLPGQVSPAPDINSSRALLRLEILMFRDARRSVKDDVDARALSVFRTQRASTRVFACRCWGLVPVWPCKICLGLQNYAHKTLR